ncbi:Cytochrome c heme lyase subunit CcmL [hydrothermal vent metagenome]|uniref:Cytochrome c heme lyase subunit CcmL n=1 Tax=hydrothermal vent metagenome TaxID=652676 RepID=A0A1W1DIK0_9ZZZZ
MLSFSSSILAESIEAKAFSSDAQETRYRALIDEIRCPVCQGQSIGGSNAGLAKDLREQVRKMIIKNNSNDEIRQFMVDRYGDFVVFKPPVNKNTYLLWFAPFTFLGLVLFFFIRSLLSKKKTTQTQTIDTSKAKDLLK